MIRWLAVLPLLLLSGCATYGHYYDDGYYARDGYYQRDDRYHAYDDYVPRRGGYGDYWYGYDRYDYPGYFSYPAYYSLFYPLNRWYYDPYWYPGYYYGITFFPRNYLSFSFSYGHGRGWGHPYRGWFAYSPYRFGWSDWYYDWSPWYAHYPRYRDHYLLPRHGSARNEAERIARLVGADRVAPRSAGLREPGSRYDGLPRNPARDADYGNRRALPRSGGDGVVRGGRGADYGSRHDAGALRRELPSRLDTGDGRFDAGRPAVTPRQQREFDDARNAVPDDRFRVERRSRADDAGIALPRGYRAPPADRADYQRRAYRAGYEHRGYEPGDGAARRALVPARDPAVERYDARTRVEGYRAPQALPGSTPSRSAMPQRSFEAPTRSIEPSSRPAAPVRHEAPSRASRRGGRDADYGPEE